MQRLRAVAAIVNIRFAVLALGISALAISQSATGAAQAPQGPRGDQDYKHDTSKKLTDIPPTPYAPKPEHEANRHPRRVSQHKNEPDSVAETTVSTAAMPSTEQNFNGIGFPGVACNCAPPDTNGEVGDTQYVQIVNEGFQVFNKSTGASVFGPVGIETLWNGFGGVCQSNGHGDPIVNYDQIANRWVVSQFAGVSVPTDECIAVSTTSDATGSYHRYAFHLGSNFFDYPKLAVWPDAYYMAMNVFNSAGTSFLGPQPFAFDRAAMLAGSPASFITTGITGGSSEETYLPADLDGKTLPPAGAPNTFVEWPRAGVYRLYHFHADFAIPANSTFTLFASPPVAAFTQLCGGGACVPQSGTTSMLDGLGDRLMFRAAYRNFGDHESLITNYTVSSGSVAGVRWLELRNVTFGPVTVYQESTYQPDTTWRWMGSAAMDGNGNLSVGYSASSASIFPQIRYAGRLASDPLNTLPQGEATLFAGTGSQTGTSNRWGDYSALTVDPIDDCTFWYTTEYYATTTSFNWRTRIGSFKFPTCGSVAPPPSLAIAKTADAASVPSGSPIGFTVTLTNSGAGAATNVSASDSLPTGTGISWSLAAPSAGWSLNGTSLAYSAASLAGGTSTSVHVVSATTNQSCGTYNNTASFLSGNGGQGASGQASTVVTCATGGPVAALTTSNSCSVFATSTPTPLSVVNYSVRGPKIQTVSPNTFFYWVKVNAAAGGNTFTIPQTITSGNFASLFQEGTSSVFDAACGTVAGAAFSQQSVNAVSGNVTVTFNAASAGTRYIGLQLTGSSLKKDAVPSPNTTVNYTLSTINVTGSGKAFDLVKQ